MNADANALLVELFLSNGRIQGVTHEVQGRKRLLDVLTDGSATLKLEEAKAVLGSSMSARTFDSINIEKRSILAAIPHETAAQQRQRSMSIHTVGRTETRPVEVTLLIPPFIVEGAIHVPPGFNAGAKLTADPQVFASFVSVTGARLLLPSGVEIETPVLLVNRDTIAGVSVTSERRSLRETA